MENILSFIPIVFVIVAVFDLNRRLKKVEAVASVKDFLKAQKKKRIKK